MLHVVNGDSVIASFQQVKLPGAYISWKDVLHDGPVPATSTLEELSAIRAEALSNFGWGDYQTIRAGFAERDRALADFRKHEEVVLWFEHDLYDQLQLLQVLDWFAAQERGKVRLHLIQINSYPGVQPFHGLGQLTGTQLAKLFPMRKTVTPEQLAAAKKVWQAFRAPDPQELVNFTQQDVPGMPFLCAALRRFLEEYPWTRDGLPRMQRQVLQSVGSGAKNKGEIYLSSRKSEQFPWGDASVYLRVDSLTTGPAPALRKTPDGDYTITEQGRDLLSGKADWVELCRGIDVWLGGVHLSGADAGWRWDDQTQKLVPST